MSRWDREKIHLRFLLLVLLAGLAGPKLSGLADETAEAWKKRDAWQRPEEVMDALRAASGSAVADVGCGKGYFTFHLAARVSEHGKVYAVDVKDDVLSDVRHRAKEEHLGQIEAVVGAPEDPHLPAETLDAILVVNAYHEFHYYDAMLQAFKRALKDGGRLVIIEQGVKPGKPREDYFEKHKMPEEVVREDLARNGFRFLREEHGFSDPTYGAMYFLIFEKP